MPYENSLVVLSMNGPQLKAVLERAYRNYYYYKYVPGYGGYSYYTTCMIDTNAGNADHLQRSVSQPCRMATMWYRLTYRRQAGRLQRRHHLLQCFHGQLPGGRFLQLQRRRRQPLAARPDRG